MTARRIAQALTVLALIALAVSMTLSADAAEVCPESEGTIKVEGGNLNDIVLPAGTVFCVKGGQVKIEFIEADGVTTLFDYLGTGQDVSHFVTQPEQEEEPSSTTTEVTTPPSSSTTTTEQTTTTISVSSTSVPVTSVTSATSTTEVPQDTTTPTLPFTGIANSGFTALLSLALIAVGYALATAGRSR